MELFTGLSDDQKALAGCAIAVAVCGSLLALSNLFGRRSAESSDQPTLRFPTVMTPADAASTATAEEQPVRRAA